MISKSLDVYEDGGTLHLLIADHHEELERSFLRYQRSENEGRSWSDPVRVDEGAPAPYARGRGTDFHVAAFGDRLVSVWMTKGSGFMGRGPLVAAYSDDGGKNWQLGATPADDGTDGDHAFIDLSVDLKGHFHCVWLDTRAREGKGLYAPTSTDGGKTWSRNRTIDEEACDCCWNIITSDSRGNLYVLYRDKDPRDMALAISRDGGRTWSRSGWVGAFQWDFDGCPHVGGGIAVGMKESAPQVHTLVWTGKPDHTGIYYLQSTDPQKQWSEPQRLGGKGALHPDIAINPVGHVTAVWDEPINGHSTVFSALSVDNGATWSEPHRLTDGRTDASHPRVTGLDDAFIIFWTQKDDKGFNQWAFRSK